MAKIISPFVGSAKGKLGGAVYYTRTGGTFARQRVATVANPKTEAQLTTRVILSTASKAYRFFQPLADHAFQDMVGKSGNHNEFMRLNTAFLRENVEGAMFNSKGDDRPLPNYYYISKGSLPSAEIASGTFSPLPGSESSSNGSVLVVRTSAATLTYNVLLEALGLDRGTQLTFVSAEGERDSRNYRRLVFSRLILAPADGDYDAVIFNNDGTVKSPNAANFGMANMRFEVRQVGQDFTGFEILFASKEYNFEEEAIAGSTVIFSINEGGRWLRSTAQMSYIEDDVPDGYSIDTAVQSYKDGNYSSLYLNHANLS